MEFSTQQSTGIVVPGIISFHASHPCRCGACTCSIPGSCSCSAKTGNSPGSSAGTGYPGQSAGSKTRPVTDLAPAESATIIRIHGNERTVLRLTDLGLTAGTTIRMMRKAPLDGPVEIAVRRTKLAIDRVIADRIHVQLPGDLRS